MKESASVDMVKKGQILILLLYCHERPPVFDRSHFVAIGMVC